MIPPFRRDFDAARDPDAARIALGMPTGTWTPTITFSTLGDLAVVYSVRIGTYTKIGRLVTATFNLVTTTFTHTTASGNLRITGLPFTSANVTNQQFIGSLAAGGITKATYTQFVTRIPANVTYVEVQANGSGVAGSAVAAADMPTGGSVLLRSTIQYEIS